MKIGCSVTMNKPLLSGALAAAARRRGPRLWPRAHAIMVPDLG